MRYTRWNQPLCRFFPGLMLLALALASSGCGGKGTVSGRVTYNGKPVVFGAVQMLASDGQQYSGNLDPDGYYSIPNVPAGAVKVAVYSISPEDDYQLRKGIQMDPEAAKAVPKPDPELVKSWFPISETYRYPETSGLEYKVKGGKNEIDITLDRAPETVKVPVDPKLKGGSNPVSLGPKD